MSTQYGRLSQPRLGPDLLRLVRSGKVYSLAYPIHPDTPYGETVSGVSIRLHRRHQDFTCEGPFGEATERIELSGHAATHLDALCHISEEVDGLPLLYGDIPALEVQGERGFAALGIEGCPPVMVRGVLLDVARDKGWRSCRIVTASPRKTWPAVPRGKAWWWSRATAFSSAQGSPSTGMRSGKGT